RNGRPSTRRLRRRLRVYGEALPDGQRSITRLRMKRLLICVVIASCATAPKTAPAERTQEMPTFTTPPRTSELLSTSADEFANSCDATIAKAKELVAKLKALPKGSPDADVLALYDEVVDLTSNAGARSGLAKEVHPDVKFREACEACEQKIEAYG